MVTIKNLSELFGDTMLCDICHKEKTNVRYANLINKWICSDCMGVDESNKPVFSFWKKE